MKVTPVHYSYKLNNPPRQKGSFDSKRVSESTQNDFSLNQTNLCRRTGYALVACRKTDADIRLELLTMLRNHVIPVEQAIAVATLHLSLYWANGFYSEASQHYDEAQRLLVEYVNNFGYGIDLEALRTQSKVFEPCSTITA